VLALTTTWRIGLGLLGLGAAVLAGALVVGREGVAPGETVRKELPNGESHEYRVSLEPGQVLDVTVEQKGVDVSLILLDPAGKILLDLDSPSGTEGVERLVGIAEAGGPHLLRVRAAAGRTPGERGRYVMRLAALRSAGPQERSQAQAFREYFQGETFRRKGSPEAQRRALLSYRRAFDLWRSLEDAPQQLIVARRQGRILRDLGELSAAVDAYRQVLPLARDPRVRVELLNYLAVLHARLGEVREALQAGAQAVALAPRTGDPVAHAAALSNLGLVYRAWGENDKALDSFKKSLEKWHELGQPHSQMALTLCNQAEALLAIGSPKPAIRLLEEALRAQEELGNPGGGGETYRVLGVAYDQLGPGLLALSFFDKARQRAHQTGNRWTEALALSGKGSTLLKMGEIGQAGEAFSEAGRIAREAGHPANEAYAMAGSGKVLLEQGDGAGALAWFTRSEALYRQLGDPNALSMVLYGIALAQRSLGRIEDSLASIDDALSLVESLRGDIDESDLQAQVIGSRADLYDLRVDLLLRLHASRPDRGYDEDAFAASEWRRARSLLEAVKELGAEIPKSLPPDILRSQRGLRNRLLILAQERLKEGSGSARIEEQIRETVAQWEALSEKIRRLSPGYSAVAEPKLVGVREVQELLDPDTALIAYTVGEERSILWWIERDSLEVHQQLRARAELEPLVLKAHGFMSRPPRTKQHRLADGQLAQLGEILLGPVLDRLPRVRRLVVVGDEALQILPFAALPVPGSGEPLVETHAVIQLPSASLAAALRARRQEQAVPPGEGLAVFADPVFDASDARFHGGSETRGRVEGQSVQRKLARLPHSSREADAILALVPAGASQRFVGFDANRRAAMDPGLARFRYIHFATHGIVDLKNPSLSGIQLSRIDPQGRLWEGEGILPFYEVYNMNLPADLVTLSACRSAVGLQVRGEGPLGMSRSFLYAGADRVVGALWDVDDSAAADLMILFYQGLLRDRKPPALALQDAQRAMRSREKRRSPHYWAGFVLQGDWR